MSFPTCEEAWKATGAALEGDGVDHSGATVQWVEAVLGGPPLDQISVDAELLARFVITRIADLTEVERRAIAAAILRHVDEAPGT